MALIAFMLKVWYNREMVAAAEQTLFIPHDEQEYLAERLLSAAENLEANGATPETVQISLGDIAIFSLSTEGVASMGVSYEMNSSGMGRAEITTYGANVIDRITRRLAANGDSWEQYGISGNSSGQNLRISNQHLMESLGEQLAIHPDIPPELFSEESLNGLEFTHILADFLRHKAKKEKVFREYSESELLVSGELTDPDGKIIAFCAESLVKISMTTSKKLKEVAILLEATFPLGEDVLKKYYKYGVQLNGNTLARAGGFVGASSTSKRFSQKVLGDLISADSIDPEALGYLHSGVSKIMKSKVPTVERL